MKAIPSTVLLALIVTACASQRFQPADPFAAFVKPPPKAVRFIMGEWDLVARKPNEIQHCTLSVVGGAYVPLLVQSCVYSTGCCNGEGLPLLTQAPGVYFEETAQH